MRCWDFCHQTRTSGKAVCNWGPDDDEVSAAEIDLDTLSTAQSSLPSTETEDVIIVRSSQIPTHLQITPTPEPGTPLI